MARLDTRLRRWMEELADMRIGIPYGLSVFRRVVAMSDGESTIHAKSIARSDANLAPPVFQGFREMRVAPA